MASATDIITYIGVPLAVLGVLPILYTFALALLTQRRIRSTLLRHGHKPANTRNAHDGFTIRGSPMTSLIEVELPRYTIAPLDRNSKPYWQLSKDAQDARETHHLVARAPTTISMIEEGRVHGYLRGGTWRMFNWKRLPVGKKLYRIQYEDELKEPPADIEFAQLVNFLLDRGAELNALGWERLRTAGLWTPAGTVLLQLGQDDRAKNRRYNHDWVLRTGTPDDSEGILTLCVKWPTEEHHNSATADRVLPPGWARLQYPVRDLDEDDEATSDNLLARIANSYKSLSEAANSSKYESVRFTAERGIVQSVSWENDQVDSGVQTSLAHLLQHSLGSEWFTAATASLLSLDDTPCDIKAGTFTANNIPATITTFLASPSMPCGVLVLLDILPDSLAPDWETEKDDPGANSARMGRQMLARSDARAAAERLEATMTHQQASVHKANRQRQEMQDLLQDSMQQQRERREKEERRERDAINSPRMSYKTAAEHCLAYLIKRKQVPAHYNIHGVVQAVLFLLMLDQSTDGAASRVFKVLTEWMKWSEAGGMKVEQLRILNTSTVDLCLAACLAAVVAERCEKYDSSASVHMLECLAHWKMVRLG